MYIHMVENPNQEIKRITQLPRPYEGVAQEVLFEILSDRATFVRKALANMHEENPALVKHLIHHCIASPNRDISLDFCLGYYEILSRSARKDGMRLFLVPDETIKSYSHEQIQILENLGEEEAINHIKKIEKQDRELTDEEIQRSDEFGEFLVCISQWRMHALVADKSSEELQFTIEPLYAMRRFLYYQQEINKFKQNFPKA